MDTEAVLALLEETAETLVRPRFRALEAGDITDKGVDDLVTIADREAEVAITRVLQEAYPDALILGEEANEADPQLVERYWDAEHSFTIDPVDGTYNFVHGNPDYAVMVAEVRGGEVVRSWILEPENGLALVAEKGAGAWRNGERLTTATPDPDPMHWRGAVQHPGLQGGAVAGLAPLAPIRGCAGVDHGLVAQGIVDFVTFNHANPWDHAPGSLLIAEAGGVTLLQDGTRYRPTVPGRAVLSARTAEQAAQVYRLLGAGFAG